MPTDPAHDLLVLEYEQLKAEQRARITVRDNLVYVTVAAYAAVVAAVLASPRRSELLLLLPAVAIVLGWTHLAGDGRISALGRYMRGALAPRLERLHPEAAPVFAWETEHRGERRRPSRKALQLTADLMTFTVPAVAALVLYWASAPFNLALTLVAGAELVLVVIALWQRVLHADLR
ncbi:hypothetical protein [Actinoplanes sp. DH11]|uniref:hypothetical protein n=1 Tax=Actinoplanes sp. DH11 TaxID=2857011 RepID=UPI001E5CB762|nr:hypothetical protein [Actinoplanes sp. DH11]